MCAGLMSGWGCRDGSPGGGDESIHSANHSPAYMCNVQYAMYTWLIIVRHICAMCNMQCALG